MNKIIEIYNNELDKLKNAIKDGKSLYHTFTLSSINNNFPESRTIVLRNVSINPFKIYFNTDYRSPKIQQLINQSDCSALFYDIKSRIQIRLKCKAYIHYQNSLSNQIWKKTQLQSRKCYMGPYAPSKPLDDWHPNIPLEYSKKDPDKNKSEEGYINFAHIELVVIETDVLKLHHDGHMRFKYDNKNNAYYISP
jgi:pyridoxamine 5'-phosphate oxidase